MPTGYTAPVMDGDVTDVKDYAAACARAFGAFMHQRDDSNTATLRYPEPVDNTYYMKRLAAAKKRLSVWEQMNEELRYAEWSEYVKDQTILKHKARAETAEKRARYEHMLVQVHGIDVPAMLDNFKDFMVSQLQESIDFDCGGSRFEDDYYSVQNYVEWCNMETRQILRDVSYYSEQLDKEQKRHAERVEYIDTMAETFGFEVEK